MQSRLNLGDRPGRSLVALAGLWWITLGCEATDSTQGGTGGSVSGGSGGTAAGLASGGDSPTGAGPGTGGTGGGGTTGGAATGGAVVECTPAATGDKTHSAGNYDNVSCNKPYCHGDEIGGWVYASARGYPWIAGATVTITNGDGSTLSTVSGEDGFFTFGQAPAISSPYTVCVSKCPSTDCNLTTHTSVDCLSAGCHALPTQRIYVTTQNTGGTGGTVPGENCAQPVTGGPYVHLEQVYSTTSNQPCVNCHLDVTPNYKGGFLYDGATSSTTIAEATITLKPASSPPLVAVTGPDGMFFFGTVGTTTTAQAIPTPYTACVSKCPTSEICSLENQHTTDADCGTCHNGTTTGKVYLR
ncbi:MAG: carboxypeptidase regulatory-like domain-containing protein [Polyangiaceae bacterium]|nr:carboxypeptidase regulatory-like domain-containing protein [Polyangiaceae bacterium]